MQELTSTIYPTDNEIHLYNSYFEFMTSPGIYGTDISNISMNTIEFIHCHVNSSQIVINFKDNGVGSFCSISFFDCTTSTTSVDYSPAITCFSAHSTVDGSFISTDKVVGNYHNLLFVRAELDFHDSNCTRCIDQGGSGITFTAGNGYSSIVQRMIFLHTQCLHNGHLSCVAYAGNKECPTSQNTIKCCLWLANSALYLAGAQDSLLTVIQCISRDNSNAGFIYKWAPIEVYDSVIGDTASHFTFVKFGTRDFSYTEADNDIGVALGAVKSEATVCGINFRFTTADFTRVTLYQSLLPRTYIMKLLFC